VANGNIEDFGMNRMLRIIFGVTLLVLAAMTLRAEAGGGGGAGNVVPPERIAPVTVADNPAALGGGEGARDAFGAAQRIIKDPQDKGVVIRLDAEVDDVMFRSIQRRADMAGKMGATVVIFEVNTFGGQVTSATSISQYIKGLPAKGFITVAWVNPKAYSAGAMITASCQHVVIAHNGEYGDCGVIAVSQPLLGDGQLVPLPPTERAKLEGPVIEQFNDSADKNGWNKDALLAMVLLQAQLHEMRNLDTNQVVYVGNDKKTQLLALERPGPGGVGKGPQWKFERTIDDDKSLFTANGDMAVKCGIAENLADNEALVKYYCNIRGDMPTLGFNWAERSTVFLTSWEIRLFLFVGLIVCGLLEFSHPGVTIFGVAAVICLVLLVGAPFLTGLAQIWEIALIVVGLGIIIADLVAFGGIGLFAVPGFILMAIGLIASFIPSDPNGFLNSQSGWRAAQTGLGVVVGGTFLAVFAFWLLAKYLAFTPGFNRLQLVPGGRGAGRGSAAAAAVALTAAPTSVRDAADRPADDAVFIGAIGRAATDLRPAGKARFGEHLVGVVSYGSFIEKDTEIEVQEISGLKIVVKPRVTLTPPTA
jgi:membrane-bound serine protease (ClpP class)